jgi:hypothetical protein
LFQLFDGSFAVVQANIAAAVVSAVEAVDNAVVPLKLLGHFPISTSNSI